MTPPSSGESANFRSLPRSIGLHDSPRNASNRLSTTLGRSTCQAGTGPLTRLVGRDEEIELLLRRWARAKAGDGQVVLISGEPDIGKSRITAALAERLHVEPYLRLRYFCSPYHQDSALFPFSSAGRPDLHAMIRPHLGWKSSWRRPRLADKSSQ